MSDRILTVDEVAEYLRVHPRRVYSLVKRRGLPRIPYSERQMRFRESDVQAWIDRLVRESHERTA